MYSVGQSFVIFLSRDLHYDNGFVTNRIREQRKAYNKEREKSKFIHRIWCLNELIKLKLTRFLNSPTKYLFHDTFTTALKPKFWSWSIGLRKVGFARKKCTSPSHANQCVLVIRNNCVEQEIFELSVNNYT
jgi:hypothetical protein